MVSLHALALASRKSSNYAVVHQQIMNLIKHLVTDPDFEDDVQRRKAKYGNMDD